MEKETLINLIPPTLTLIFTSLFGLFVGVLIEKFKNRYRTITFQILSQKVKPSLSENLGGHLKIQLGEREINTLKVVTVHIRNKSSIDIENIVIRFSLSKGSWFHGNEGFLFNNSSWIFWTNSFNDLYQKVLADNNQVQTNKKTGKREVSDELQQRIDYVLANREYILPVFNRKEIATFNFLIEDPEDDTEAFIQPAIVHKSVRFKEEVIDESKKLQEILIGALIGLVFVAGVITILAIQYKEEKALIIWSAIIGTSYSIIGVLIFEIYKRIRGFFE